MARERVANVARVVAQSNDVLNANTIALINITLPMVRSSQITVDGVHFCDWFNNTYRANHKGETNPDLTWLKQPATLCNEELSKTRFIEMFDRVGDLWEPEISFSKFLAFLLIFYNETGGTLIPTVEARWFGNDVRGRVKYLFETYGNKGSYNVGPNNRLAGDQMVTAGAIQEADRKAWNQPGPLPSGASDAVIQAAAQCDFYKYRGRGLFQITFRNSYQTAIDPLLTANGYAASDALTDDQLTAAVRDDSRIYIPMVKNYISSTSAKDMLAGITEDSSSFIPWGQRISGSPTYGKIVAWRASKIFADLKGKTVITK